jgi:hypothetical protein
MCVGRATILDLSDNVSENIATLNQRFYDADSEEAESPMVSKDAVMKAWGAKGSSSF